MTKKTNTDAENLAKPLLVAVFVGENGQKININNRLFYIGDVVLITDKKSKTSKYYQIIWSEYSFQLVLENKNNSLASIHPSGSYWHTEAYIPLFKITENIIPYLEIERIGNEKKHLKLIKRIPRTGMKPIK